MSASIQVGSRIFLRNAVVGEPGMVMKLYGDRALIHWPDLDMGRDTKHSLDTLILADAFNDAQRLDYEGAAA